MDPIAFFESNRINKQAPDQVFEKQKVVILIFNLFLASISLCTLLCASRNGFQAVPSVALALGRFYPDIAFSAVLSAFLPWECETRHSIWGVLFVF